MSWRKILQEVKEELVNVIRPAALLIGARSGFHLLTQTDTLPFLEVTFQRDGSLSLRKTVLGCKADKNLGEDLHVKAAKREFTIPSFLR